MKATPEQQEILDIVKSGEGDLRINAYAGTGKTTTLKMIVESNPNKTFLYLAFNKAVAKEAEKKFPGNCSVSTVHSMAFRNFVNTLPKKEFMSKLNGFWKTKDYIKHFDMESKLRGAVPSHVNLFVFANDIKKLVSKFKNSELPEVRTSLADFGSFKRCKEVSKKLAVDIAKEIWEAEIDMDSGVPCDHGTYLKLWELSDPYLDGYDFILFDEAQDANPVMLSVVDKMGGVRKVFVGDTHQAIYGWNGAIDAMSIVNVDYECYLTKSWRFGVSVANEANKLLNILAENPPPLIGNENIISEIGPLKEGTQKTMIFRTNGALAKYAVDKIAEGAKVYIEGGVKDLCDDLIALYHLKNGDWYSGKSRYKPYRYWGEIMEESQVDVTIRRDIMFIDAYGTRTPEVLETLRKEVLTKRSIKKADVVLTTAHKSKGLEFEQVGLFDDYKLMSEKDEDNDEKESEFINREEINLLYVAITRARKNLYLSPMYELALQNLAGKVIV